MFTSFQEYYIVQGKVTDIYSVTEKLMILFMVMLSEFIPFHDY